jgi:NAD+ synthase (glutamine-hydrolysing)
MIKKASKEGVSIVTTPELSLCGYTCGDLFLQDKLIDEVYFALNDIVEETKKIDIISIVGMPIRVDNQMFNCGVVISKGKILGAIPKTYVPNYSEFYEKRWFQSSSNLISSEVNILNNIVPIGTNIIFRDKDIAFGVEICEDLWCVNPPSNSHTLHGANIIFNLSSSNEVIGKYEYRKNLVSMQSAKTISAYVYASSGVMESTSDILFSGASMIYENGTKLCENERFDLESNLIYTDVDINKLNNDRNKNISYMGVVGDEVYRYIDVDIVDKKMDTVRVYPEYPFVPKDESTRDERCKEIFTIQASALARRLVTLGNPKCVIGISGGLDSTLAFLVIVEAYKKLGIDNKNIIGVTMPGFGTTGRTYNNACKFVEAYGATLREVDIKAACIQHMKDIGLDENDRSVAYENTQARERTQILMDIANMENGLVIGTGDLSELALGWCTYNGDHMSMYSVNTSIPKTLVRYLVKWVADTSSRDKKEVIYDILDTPISPELLPPDEAGNILQKTESSIGPYVLHDFFLYHFLRYGASPKKIYYLAKNTFKDNFSDEEILKWLKVFVRRFFTQQFKRNCVPDGVKVGSISLSPRGDLRMPSDASYSIWIRELEEINK